MSINLALIVNKNLIIAKLLATIYTSSPTRVSVYLLSTLYNNNNNNNDNITLIIMIQAANLMCDDNDNDYNYNLY